MKTTFFKIIQKKKNKEMDRKNKEYQELNKNLIGVIQKKQKKFENELEKKEKIIIINNIFKKINKLF